MQTSQCLSFQSDAEFNAKFLSTIDIDKIRQREMERPIKYEINILMRRRRAAPERFDLRDTKCITPVKDQVS